MPSVVCSKCRSTLPEDGFNRRGLSGCPGCQSLLQVEVFPALYRAPASLTTGERIVVDGEASCFYHPQKKAAVPCDACGRFICPLCDVELSGQHLCPRCLESGKRKKKVRNLEDQRTLYDRFALTLAIVPILFWPATAITAPATIFVVLRYWKAPGSIVPRNKRLSFVVAALFALVQIGAWTLLLAAMFLEPSSSERIR